MVKQNHIVMFCCGITALSTSVMASMRRIITNYKRTTAHNKGKSYVALLIPIKANSDNELVASVNTWGSTIDKPPKKKRNKSKATNKNAKKRKVDNPLNTLL